MSLKDELEMHARCNGFSCYVATPLLGDYSCFDLEEIRNAVSGAPTVQREVPTMRDRFALAIITGDMASGGEVATLESVGNRTSYARIVYDFAEALDAERRRRNAEEGR